MSKRFRDRAPRREDGDVDLTFLPPRHTATDYYGDLSATRRLERSRRQLLERVERLTAEVIAIEDDFQVHRRWEPTDEQYIATLTYIHTRRYQRALGKLQRLVIQRLFELHKLNLAQTGMYVPITDPTLTTTVYFLQATRPARISQKVFKGGARRSAPPSNRIMPPPAR